MMKLSSASIISALFLVMLLVMDYSCKEESDNIFPVIEFISPPGETGFSVDDTIHARADITDDQRIINVKISIVNMDKQPVSVPIFRYPGTSSYSLEENLTVTDKSLDSGPYDIEIQASDGYNIKFKYQRIYLEGTARIVEGFLSVTRSGPSSTHVNRLNTDFIPDTLVNFPYNYRNSIYQPGSGQFYFVTAPPSRLISSLLDSFEEVWQVTAPFPEPMYNDIKCDREVFVSTASGDIWGYSAAGMVVFKTEQVMGSRIGTICPGNDQVYAEVISKNNGEVSFSSYYRATGSLARSVKINRDIVSIVENGAGTFVFTSGSITSSVYEYNPEELALYPVLEAPGEIFQDAIDRNGNEIYLLTNGGVMLFDPGNYTLHELAAGNWSIICYEDLSNHIYLGTQTSLDIADGTTGDIIQSITFDEPLLGFHIVYNQ